MKYTKRLKPRGEPRNEDLRVRMTPEELAQLTSLQTNLDPGVHLSRAVVVRRGLSLLHELVRHRMSA
jgi:hypothetical protein